MTNNFTFCNNFPLEQNFLELWLTSGYVQFNQLRLITPIVWVYRDILIQTSIDKTLKADIGTLHLIITNLGSPVFVLKVQIDLV